MKMTSAKQLLSFIVCVLLIAASALCMSGCNDTTSPETPATTTAAITTTAVDVEEVTTTAPSDPAPTTDDTTVTQPTSSPTNAKGHMIIGQGDTIFAFSVTHADGTAVHYEIHTDKHTVGDALYSLGLIDGDNGDFGLYVKTVDGQTLDYNKDGYYWSFYVDGSYAMAGVETTDIIEGQVYAFKAEKA